MKLLTRTVVLCLMGLALLMPVGVGLAQATEFRLNLQRTFGFGNGSMIRGLFTASIVGPATPTITGVSFLLDGQVMADVKQPPFEVKFDTGKYSTGWHDLSAVVLTGDGRKVTTPVRRFQFASADEESAVTSNIIAPILGFAFVVILISIGGSMLSLRGKGAKTSLPLGAARQYGLAGGTICPNCQRPFALHWWAMNMLTGKYDRCDYCGRRGIFKRASREQLVAAEAAELRQAQPEEPIREKSAEEKLKEMLDESRFTDSI